jgi:predicted GIY-YIG superfamily endonuclease
MKYLYLLHCKGDGTFYAGSTHDVMSRYREHENGMHPETKNRLPVDLVYYEAYTREDRADGRLAELEAKGQHYHDLLARLGY